MHTAKNTIRADLPLDRSYRNAECSWWDQAHLLIWPLVHEWQIDCAKIFFKFTVPINSSSQLARFKPPLALHDELRHQQMAKITQKIAIFLCFDAWNHPSVNELKYSEHCHVSIFYVTSYLHAIPRLPLFILGEMMVLSYPTVLPQNHYFVNFRR